MTHQANYRMVVLFEDEVREAARALAAYRALPDDADDEAFEAASKAFRLCTVALLGAEDDAAALVLSRKPA
jgi:hypothetical protein